MQHPELATWLRQHKESLVASSEHFAAWGKEEEAFDATLIDIMIETARTGRPDPMDAAVGRAAHRAAMQEIPLGRLLKGPRRLKEAMWSRLKGGDLPASKALPLIEAAEPIFSRLIQVIIQSYFEANQQMQDALASEIARMHREAERRVMDRTADLARANIELSKLEQAKTDFISIAAHELKTPLTLIRGYTNMLCEMDLEADGTIGAMNMLSGILRGTERLSTIVEDMLDVSVIDTDALSLRIEQVSLASSVNMLVAQNERNLKGRSLAVHIGDLTCLPRIEIDSHRLHQILTHLLNNAIRYTPDGGEIFIEGRILPGERPAKERKAGKDLTGDDVEFVELTFRDTGIGIAPEDRERIFEKFYRVGKSTLHSTGKVKFKGAGTGLGLPIARGLAEAHGGRLWAESPGHDEVNFPGSTFHLLLPIRAMPKPGITATWLESLDKGDESGVMSDEE